ncbi:LacI family DNA-binding transcriptional regulator [Vagococcus fluvialis]|uniref:LacI family transcriptional regulator n=1 Tax=Vagococcus fluvialis TaxID=2738 RepID=A0A7X6I413_9ENTE|nr:LacI family DNA-binding transcriptional regulator [Vagococcus fluvialis]NKC69158.1 LacI family transcriptional regulator [Vagococcus fluvialis]
MATIKDVAKLAGVSVATVSRVINKNGYSSEAVQVKVNKAIEELDYRPNEIARSLFQKKSKFVGLLLPDITNPFFPLIAKGAEQYLEENGYQLLLGNTENNPQKEESYVNSFIQNNVSGIIVATGEKWTYSKDIPYVMVDRMTDDNQFLVISDNYNGGYLAGKEICLRNPGKVLLMKGPEEFLSSNARNKGVEKALQDFQVNYDIFEVQTYSSEISQDVAKKFFEEYTEIDSVIATNDMHGLAILQQALKRGINVPEELQIIGYDGIPLGQMVYPSLSTIQQPILEMGREAAKALLDHVIGEVKSVNKVLPVNFYEGETLRDYK